MFLLLLVLVWRASWMEWRVSTRILALLPCAVISNRVLSIHHYNSWNIVPTDIHKNNQPPSFSLPIECSCSATVCNAWKFYCPLSFVNCDYPSLRHELLYVNWNDYDILILYQMHFLSATRRRRCHVCVQFMQTMHVVRNLVGRENKLTFSAVWFPRKRVLHRNVVFLIEKICSWSC